jgi:hypothetical protein
VRRARSISFFGSIRRSRLSGEVGDDGRVFMPSLNAQGRTNQMRLAQANSTKVHIQRKALAKGWRSWRFIRMANSAKAQTTAMAEMLKAGPDISAPCSLCRSDAGLPTPSGGVAHRPAAISVNMFASGLAVTELLFRAHPFREDASPF